MKQVLESLGHFIEEVLQKKKVDERNSEKRRSQEATR